MKCENCGAQMQNGTMFCSECGKQMAPPSAPAQHGIETELPTANPKKTIEKSGINIVLIVLTTVIVAAISVLVTILVMKSHNNQSDNVVVVTAEPTEAPTEAPTEEPTEEPTETPAPTPEVVVVVVTPEPAPYNAGTILKVVNCRQWISLRVSPSEEATRIAEMPLGTTAEFIAPASNGFYQVRYNGQVGYALASYLTYAAPSDSAVSSSTTIMRVVNCNEWISLRATPSESAQRLDTIPLGAVVEFISTSSNGFYQVKYNGKVGYALASYLTNASSSVTIMRVVNCNEWISLRATPSESAQRLDTIPLGAVVEFISTSSNGFHQVKYNGKTGYALASYLEYN